MHLAAHMQEEGKQQGHALRPKVIALMVAWSAQCALLSFPIAFQAASNEPAAAVATSKTVRRRRVSFWTQASSI
jgi:hypothetical protein